MMDDCDLAHMAIVIYYALRKLPVSKRWAGVRDGRNVKTWHVAYLGYTFQLRRQDDIDNDYERVSIQCKERRWNIQLWETYASTANDQDADDYVTLANIRGRARAEHDLAMLKVALS